MLPYHREAGWLRMALAQRGSDRGCSTGLGKGQEADLGEEAQLWRPRPVLSKGETINKLQRDHFLCEKRLFQKHRVNAGFPGLPTPKCLACDSRAWCRVVRRDTVGQLDKVLLLSPLAVVEKGPAEDFS